MANKLSQGEYPPKHAPDDFECFGPPATRDGEFTGTKIVDMGFFDQPVGDAERTKDSNKYYHASVVQSKKDKAWYAYFQWGRTGATNPSFQFVECDSESEALAEYEKQCHAKNDKRGEWTTVAGIKTLQPKKGKDAYLVRPQATRSTGLPSAKYIKANEGAKAATTNTATVKKTTAKSTVKIDTQTVRLLRDLGNATVSYTMHSMADASLPTQAGIDEARTILLEARKRVAAVKKAEDQVKDKDLFEMTRLLYGRIPKIKPVGAGPDTWVLSQDNIVAWEHDLDAFESALYTEVDEIETGTNPYGDMRLEMEWIDPKSAIGKWLYDWWPKASANRHSIGPMKIINMWRINRFDDEGNIDKWQNKVDKEIKEKHWVIKERPPFQPTERPDVSNPGKYRSTNTSFMFHGTRTVNVTGILRSALRLPKQLVGVSINGAAFGPGIYWASDWRKSAGYTSMRGSCWAGGDGGIQRRGAFMFTADVVLGMPWLCKTTGGYTKPYEDKHHIWAKPGVTSVMNDEFIIFDAKQNSLRYLCEFDT